MARKPVDHIRPYFPLAGLFLAWILLPIPIKKALRKGFHEFQAPSWEALSWGRDLQNFWSVRTQSHSELISQGRDLARLNGAYRLQVMENESLRQEIKRMETLLDLPPRPRYHYEVARVTHRQIGTWWHEMTVRKGRDHGILEGNGVVYAGGVVGKVQKVYSGTSVVRLVTSPGFRMPATFQGQTQPLYIQGWQGGGLNKPQGRVRNVPISTQVSPDSPGYLVSTSLGQVFPNGLHIGKVEQLEQASNGLFQEGTVTFPSELYNLNEVAILVYPSRARPAKNP